MSVDYASANDASKDAEEQKRTITQDYIELFATEQGQRVLAHLIEKVLMMSVNLRNGTLPPQSPVGPQDALYLISRQDAAREILEALNTDYAKFKPTVKRHRFTARG